MTPQTDIIPQVRRLLQDEIASSYRWSDAELLGWITAALDAIVDLRPELFNAQFTHVCTAGVEQELVEPRVRQFQEVVRIVGGPAVTPTSREILDLFNPAWPTTASGAAIHWMPHPESFKKFYVYKPAAAGQQLLVRCVQSHAPITATTDSINLPENYAPAIQAFVIYRAESKDDEQINSGRAQAFMSDFAGMIGAGKGA